MAEQVHPDHYTYCKDDLGLEVIDILDYFFSDEPHLWNAGKYLLRFGHKHGGGVDDKDLEKAMFYIERRNRLRK